MMPAIAPNTIRIDYTPQGAPHSTTGLLSVAWDLTCPAHGTWQGYATLVLEAGACDALLLRELPEPVRVGLMQRVREIRRRAEAPEA